MKYYKTKEGWYCLDSKEILPYGSIIISWYNKVCLNTIRMGTKVFSEDEVKICRGIDFLLSELYNTETKYKYEINQLINEVIYNLHEEFLLYFELINNNLELIYDTEKIDDAVFLLLDLKEIEKSIDIFGWCPICSNYFIKSSSKKRKKYCSTECRNVAKKRMDKERSNTPAGYNQKTINYLRNVLNFSEDEIIKYRDESEKMKKELDEKQFILWIEEKRNYYKSLNKK